MVESLDVFKAKAGMFDKWKDRARVLNPTRKPPEEHAEIEVKRLFNALDVSSKDRVGKVELQV